MSGKSINNISALSRVEVSDIEGGSLQKDLDQILGYIEKLGEVDVSEVAPFYHPHEMTLRLRPDEAQAVAGVNSLKASKGFENRLVRVPRIIE